MTLDQLLSSRDRRAAMQKKLLALHPAQTLLVFTIVMPGEEKQTRASAIIAEAGVSALQKSFGQHITSCLIRDIHTGFEAYLTIDLPLQEVKQRAITIEESHPLGRLMDIDIIDNDGKPITRGTSRRCLLCSQPARHCMRARTHTLTEILSFIDSCCDEYIQRP